MSSYNVTRPSGTKIDGVTHLPPSAGKRGPQAEVKKIGISNHTYYLIELRKINMISLENYLKT